MRSVNSFLVISMLSGIWSACSSSCDKPENDSHNVVLETILARKSVREYLDKEIEPEKIAILLKAGMAAPSGKDIRPWEFIVINERSTLDSLANILPTAKMLAEAPAAIIVCGDSTRSSYWYLDCSAATENILLAAQSIGLGAVWTAAYPYKDRMQAIRKYISMPEKIYPLCVVPVGYPKEEKKPKNKFDKAKIHDEKY